MKRAAGVVALVCQTVEVVAVVISLDDGVIDDRVGGVEPGLDVLVDLEERREVDGDRGAFAGRIRSVGLGRGPVGDGILSVSVDGNSRGHGELDDRFTGLLLLFLDGRGIHVSVEPGTTVIFSVHVRG